jgi:DNA-directed RNA polymerase specialized sigma24 family protein
MTSLPTLSARCASPQQRLSILLERAAAGDRAARTLLWEVAYPEVLRIAATAIRGWHGRVSLGEIDVANETFVRLIGRDQVTSKGAAYFFRCCLRECQRILIDHWRRKRRARRVELVDVADDFEGHEEEEVLRCATAALARRNLRASRVAEDLLLRGTTPRGCAERLGLSLRTVQAELAQARSWFSKWLGMGTRGALDEAPPEA